jgi:hypothetical protein
MDRQYGPGKVVAAVKRQPLGSVHLTRSSMRLCLLLIVTFQVFGCALTYRDTVASDPRYNPHRPEQAFTGVGPGRRDSLGILDGGAFYVKRFAGAMPPPNNLLAMIRDLYTRGFEITHAWILYDWNCTHLWPESRESDYDRHPFLVVHLAIPDDNLVRLFKFNFTSASPGPKCRAWTREDLIHDSN